MSTKWMKVSLLTMMFAVLALVPSTASAGVVACKNSDTQYAQYSISAKVQSCIGDRAPLYFYGAGATWPTFPFGPTATVEWVKLVVQGSSKRLGDLGKAECRLNLTSSRGNASGPCYYYPTKTVLPGDRIWSTTTIMFKIRGEKQPRGLSVSSESRCWQSFSC